MLTFSSNIVLLSNYIFRYLAVIFLFITVPANAQNNSTVTFNGIGEIKLGMEKIQLEKLLNETIAVPNITSNKAGVYKEDTIHITYKGIDVDIMLQSKWAEMKDDIEVGMIKSNSVLLKTKSGIGIGDDKQKILSTYKDYSLHMYPYYDDDTIRIKGKSSIHLFSSDGFYSIIFYLTDDKVSGFGLKIIDGD
jgi:hypothetical protein